MGRTGMPRMLEISSCLEQHYSSGWEEKEDPEEKIFHLVQFCQTRNASKVNATFQNAVGDIELREVRQSENCLEVLQSVQSEMISKILNENNRLP
jgi:hypothetical protein